MTRDVPNEENTMQQQIEPDDPRLQPQRTVRITSEHFTMPADVDYIDLETCTPFAGE